MVGISNLKIKRLLFIVMLIALFALSSVKAQSQDGRPIADAGSSRYAASDPVILDGTASFDPDNSGPLIYAWQQISGPSVVISDAETATPTISGFVQTDEIQECEFELMVSDGELTSSPDTVKVIIVPACDGYLPQLEVKNDSFDPAKPTIIYFGGGGDLMPQFAWSPFRVLPWNISSPMDPAWLGKANIIECPRGYRRDSSTVPMTFYRCGDKIIAYLSAVAPNYKQPIQIVGHSYGGHPAMDVGIYLNQTYKDARYAVNRVTILDSGGAGDTTINQFLASSVDGEQCWIDNYWWGSLHVFRNILNVQMPEIGHADVKYWYGASLTYDNMNQFNNGVVAGAYWSVAGPGKNLQLASTGDYTYVFRWPGSSIHDEHGIELYDEVKYPGRLPEPVTLVGPIDVGEPNGAVLTCEESENATGYQLLFGSDPYRVMDYNIFSDTTYPPNEVITTLPFDETWWTVRIRDQYGSTIYADPKCISASNLSFRIVNLTTGQMYSNIQLAINEAIDGDELLVKPGIYHENISFIDMNLTLRSKDPNDPNVVAATVINIEDLYQGPVITLSGSRNGGCLIYGLTITGGRVGISCCDASPTIKNCLVESNGPNAIEFWEGYEPTIIDCTILGSIMECYDSDWVAHWKLDEAEGDTAIDSVAYYNGTLSGGPVWQPNDGIVDGALQFDGIDDYVSTEFVLNPADGAFSIFAWIKGGAPGQVIISQQDGNGTGNTWLGLDAEDGVLMTGLVPRKIGWVTPPPLVSESVITDGQWHHVGFVWDGSHRVLYSDGIEIAKDADAHNPLKSANGGLHIGAGKTLSAGTFFSGLIDDVHIYDVTLTTEEITALTQ